MSALSEGHLAWGLTREKHAELDAELSDHLYCLQGAEGAAAVAQARGRINSPDGRRKLTGPHLAEQVAGTLNRWPTRQEWRELCVLLLWFVLILLSDLLALQVSVLPMLEGVETHNFETGDALPLLVNLALLAWLSQAVGRAGFFASFAMCLRHAWRQGKGVCLARILQLKLIHTVLVVGTLIWLGARLWGYWFDPEASQAQLPQWLTAPLIFGIGMLIAGVILLSSRLRAWPWALGVALCAGFLYPGGPVPMLAYEVTSPIAWERYVDAKGETRSRPATDPSIIAERARQKAAWPNVISMDLAHNQLTYLESYPSRLTYHVLSADEYRGWYLPRNGTPNPTFREIVTKLPSGWRQTGMVLPQCAGGGGIGWLALPILILGFVGLTGMAMVMGRRSAGDAALYGSLCLIAIYSTVLPFLFVSRAAGFEVKMFDFGPTGVLQTPVPGFENLLIGQDMSDPWLIIFGLVLSAGVPWLVTGLFLRPRKSGLPSQRTEAN